MPVIYGVRLTGTQSGGLTENIIHLRNQEGFDIPRNQILDRLFTAFIGQIRNLQANNFTWTNMAIWNWYDEDDTPLSVPISAGGTSGAAIQYFNSMAAVFQKKTAVSGKRGRGRFYMPAPPGTNLNNGKWSNTYIINMTSVRNAIVGHFMGATPIQQLNLVLVPKEGETDEYLDLIDFFPRDYPGTQVRRNFFRGA